MSNLYFDEGQPATGRKVLLATTAYDSPSAGYVFSIQKSRMALEEAGIQTAYLLLSGNCHVDDARNVVTQHFLLTDCTDLVFIDADVYWNTNELIALCQSDADLVGGVYPYRRQGQNEKLPVILMPGETEPNDQGLLRVMGLPTGFMKIKRGVIETLCETADHFLNRAEQRSMAPILFERTFEDGARWGGDITFCRKWHRAGGKIYAMPELRLGHSGTQTLYDSLAAAIRRQEKQTIAYMADRIRADDYDPYLFAEAVRAEGNPYSALEDVLMLCALMAKKADGPIIETGSGITSVALAAATDQPVYSLEHDEFWADQTARMAKEAGVDNLHIVPCDIAAGWYDKPKGLPSEFALGLNDGPPRTLGDRKQFFDHFGDVETIIVDDADDPGYGDWLKTWCSSHGRRIDFVERSALIRQP